MIALTWAWAWIAGAAPLPREAEAEAPPSEVVAEAEPGTEAADEGDTGVEAEAEPAPLPEPEPEPALPATPQGRPTFLAGSSLVIDEQPGDVFAVARSVRVEGPFADNAFLLGPNVVIDEVIGGDAVLVAATVRINEPIYGDLYAVGGVEVRIDAPIYGNVYVGGNRVSITADVHGFVEASARELEVYSHLHDDASFQFVNVRTNDDTRIEGDLSYVAPRPRDGLDAIADGDVGFRLGDFDVPFDPSDPVALAQEALWGILGVIRSYLGLLLTGALFLAFASSFVNGPARAIVEQPIMSAALGLVAFVTIPVVGGIALLSVSVQLGIVELAVVAFGLWGAGLFIVPIFTAVAIGRAINRRFFPNFGNSEFAALAVGAVPLALLFAIPQFIGMIVWLFTSFVGFGALWLHWRDEARDHRRSRKKEA